LIQGRHLGNFILKYSITQKTKLLKDESMYIVEGNIGVGKSTFLEQMKKLDPTIDIIPEPKDTWTSTEYGQSLLSHFYENTPRWAYTLETFAMIRRIKDHSKEENNPNPFRLMERSVYSGHYCFAVNGHKSGYFSDLEWKVYENWVDFLIKDHCKLPLGFIYLQASPEVCFSRIRQRSRKSEQKLSFGYLKSIHEHHERFLVEKKGLYEELEKVPVLILDCNENFLTNDEVAKKHLSSLKSFFDQSKPIETSFAKKDINEPMI
jgi:deoxyadenosine/deoxycytidine kinase